MKLAGADFLIWIIIFLVITAVQGWKKLQGDGDDEEVETPPPVPKPRPKVNRPPRPVAPPPVITHAPPSKTWRVDPAELERLRRKFEPVPVVETVPPPPSPAMEPPPPVAVPRKLMPVVVPQTGWASRLRKPGAVRHAIVAAEILGPPKGSSL